MQFSKQRLFAAICALMVGSAVGCGDDSSSDGGDNGTNNDPPQATGGITISGNVMSHPINAVDTNIDFSYLAVAIADPVPLLFNPDAPPLAAGTVNITSECGAAKSCPFTFEHVNIDRLGLGMLAVVADTRTGADRKWVRSATGIAGAATLIQLKVSHDPLVNARAFAITRTTEAALGALIGMSAGGPALPAGTLETSGFVVGFVLDATNRPVGGATVSLTKQTGGALENVELWYLADNMQSANHTATGSNGLFIVRPLSGTGIPLGNINVTKTGMTWTTTPVGAASGAALCLNLVAVP